MAGLRPGNMEVCRPPTRPKIAFDGWMFFRELGHFIESVSERCDSGVTSLKGPRTSDHDLMLSRANFQSPCMLCSFSRRQSDNTVRLV